MARLEHLAPRVTPRPGGRGYTVFVKLLKVVLPLGALVLIGIVAAHLSKSPLREVEEAATSKNDKTAPGQIEVLNARYEGADAQGRPYTLMADRASRANTEAAMIPPGTTPSLKDADDTVLLQGLKADVFLEDKSWLAVRAKGGSYAARAQHLELAGDVSAFHDSGYEMHLDKLTVDLKTRHAWSDAPVRAQGPLGEIAAKGMEVLDSGDRVVFAGPVTLKIYRLGGKG
jgi:lipopolysaccharide export system protein LptC